MEMMGSKPWTFVVSEVLFAAVFLKGLLLAGGVTLLGLALRRASAATRSAVWTAAFGTLLLLPFLLPLLAGRVPALWDLGVTEYPRGLFEAGGSAGPAATEGGVPPAVWLAVAWAAGVLLLAGRFLLHVLRIARISRDARTVTGGPLADAAERAARELRIRAPRIALADAPGVPLTWGLGRPVILLPEEAAEWSPEAQRAVLHHEMAHVRRRDYLALVVMELCRALHWPNLLVWWMARRARMDQERACDDAAILSGISAADYARHLVAVARTYALGSRQPAGALPIVRRSTLARRVRAVMEGGASRRPATLRTAAKSLVVVGLLAAPLAVASPWTCPPDAEAAAPSARSAGSAGVPASGKWNGAAARAAPGPAQASPVPEVEPYPLATGFLGEPCTES